MMYTFTKRKNRVHLDEKVTQYLSMLSTLCMLNIGKL